MNRLVGRSADIAGVEDALRAGRLVTITGPGGVGKTRLAVELAGRRARRSVAVVLIDLSALDDDEQVPRAFAEAVRVSGAGDDALSDVVRFLAGQGALLVVDNCEHVQDAAAKAVISLLEGCPRLRVLATGREALHLPGEIVWSLGPLAPDDAVRLFVDRAEALRPGASSGAREPIERICARLEGLPLAVELAAGRAASLSPESILARLNDRLDLLSARTRATPARHRSLRATIEWSVELLSESERAGFTRLSLFPGSFSLDAAEAVAETTLDELDGVVAKSLVSITRSSGIEIRYRLLDTVRAFARERLHASGEENRLRAGHLAFYLRRAEEIQSANALGGSDAEVGELSEELDNLRAAVAWAYEHDPQAGLRLMGAAREAWFSRSQTEGRHWARRLLERHQRADRARALGLLCAGRLAVAHQDHNAGRPLLTTAAELAQALEQPEILAPALQYRGISGMLSRDLGAAAQDLARSIELFRELGQRQGVGRGLGILGFVHLYQGNPGTASRIFEDALAKVQEGDDSWGVGQVSLGLGLTAKASGQKATAIAHLHRAVASLVAAGDATILGVALSTLAGLTFEDDPRRALRLAGAAVAFRARIGGEYPPATVAELDSLRERGSDLLGGATAEAEWEAGSELDPPTIVEIIEGRRPPRQPGPLTTRQREVADLLAAGLTNAQIANKLHLSERTVENHVFNALNALGLHNRVQLATWITENSEPPRA
ncbi:MAG: LuxR C-terminal-related transcriptional regulator [Actinomycetota bacterium]|nr:LuxR C-terminal-related transcriptional regulator [Actinomycetota bacterium]